MIYRCHVLCVALFFTILLMSSRCLAADTSAPDHVIFVNRTGVLCYTCISKNIPAASRSILEKSANIPKGVQSDSCDDPFEFNNAIVEPCSSACLKVISENKEMRIVLRGCLTTIYPQIPHGYLESSSEEFNECDTQRQKSNDRSEIITQTCLCKPSFCNSSPVFSYGLSISFIFIFMTVLICHLI